MALLHRFCFWFSVRMGSIIVGIITLVQATIWLMISIISIDNKGEVENFLQELITNLSIDNKHFLHLANDPKVYLISLAVFFVFLILSCIILIVGSFRCNYYMIYPYVILDAVYFLFMLVLHVFLMLNYKKKDVGLGVLILYSNLGALILLILLYHWTCVFSFVQIIQELRKELCQLKVLPKDRKRQILTMVDMRYYQNNYVNTKY